MAVTATPQNYALLSTCNATSAGGTWTGGNAITTETDLLKYGTACVAYTCRTAATHTLNFAPSPAVNLTTGSPIIRLWFWSYQKFAATASNGIRFYIGDGTNTAYWNVLGGDTYPGGWYMVAVDTSTTQTSGTKPNMSAVTRIGLECITTGTTKNAPSTYVDHLHRADGLIAYGDAGTSTPFRLADLFTADDTLSTAWGFTKPITTVYFASGAYTIGDSGSNNTLFAADDQVLVFDTSPMANGSFGVSFLQGTGTTEVALTRTTIKAASVKFDLDCSDVLESFVASGCSFIGARVISLAAGQTFDGCSFVNCGTSTIANAPLGCSFILCDAITISGSGYLDGCTIDSSIASSAVIAANLDDVDGCTFISDGTGHAVNLGTIAATTTMGWNCMLSGYAATSGSTGNEAILVSVASGQTLTINVAAGASTPSVYNTGSGTVSVVSGQVTLTVTVKDLLTGANIEGARVYVTAAAGGSLSEGTVLIDRLLTNASGQVSETRSYATNQPITGWARKASSQPYFKTGAIAGTINNATGLSLTVQMIRDE